MYEITRRKLPRRCFDVFLGKNNFMKLQKENCQEDVFDVFLGKNNFMKLQKENYQEDVLMFFLVKIPNLLF